MRPKPLLAIALAALALIVAGCGPALRVADFTATQAEVAGPVEVVVEVCRDGGVACSDLPLDGNAFQLLVAFAVPDAASVEGVSTRGTYDLTLKEFESYRQWLEANEDAGEGRRWVAYRSDALGTPAADADAAWDVVAQVEPGGASGAPAATLPVRAAIGYRGVAGDPAESIECDAIGSCFGFSLALDETPADLDRDFPIRDLAVAEGEGFAIDRGTTADMPFGVRYAGAAASGDLPVSATTTIPGATATAPAVAFDATKDGTVPVALTVPEGAAPGDYTVTLTVAGRRRTLPVRVDAAPVPVTDLAAIAFPETRVGKADAARNVLVTNSGTRSLTVRGGELGGADAADFGIVSDECAGRTLGPGRGCIVAVHFSPRAGGPRAATLRVPTAHSDVTVALEGVGAQIPGHKDVMLLLGAHDVRTAARGDVLRRGGLVIGQTFAIAGDAAWRLRLDGLRVGQVVKRRIDAPGEQTVRIPLTTAGRRLLARRPGGRLVLTTALTDADGRRSVVRRTVGFARN